MKRKIHQQLLEWKHESNGRSALMIDGARRAGKSYIAAEEFARNEYDSYVLIDFSKASAKVKGYFQNYLNDLDFLLDRQTLTRRHNICPVEVKSGRSYAYESLGKFRRKFASQLGRPYVFHVNALKLSDGVCHLPVYMAPLLVDELIASVMKEAGVS